MPRPSKHPLQELADGREYKSAPQSQMERKLEKWLRYPFTIETHPNSFAQWTSKTMRSKHHNPLDNPCNVQICDATIQHNLAWVRSMHANQHPHELNQQPHLHTRDTTITHNDMILNSGCNKHNPSPLLQLRTEPMETREQEPWMNCQHRTNHPQSILQCCTVRCQYERPEHPNQSQHACDRNLNPFSQ